MKKKKNDNDNRKPRGQTISGRTPDGRPRNMTESYPYDDAFRTVVTRLWRLVIGFLNAVYGTDMDIGLPITHCYNEHFITHSDGVQERKMSDSSFYVGDDKSHRHHWECQTCYDASIPARNLEYDLSIAMENVADGEDGLEMTLPDSLIIVLRRKGGIPDEAVVTIRTSRGSVEHPIRIIKAWDYTFDELAGRRMYLLMPFQAFRHEKDFKKLEQDAEKRAIFIEEYKAGIETMNRLYRDGELDWLEYSTLMEMTEKVMSHLATRHTNLRKETIDMIEGTKVRFETFEMYDKGLADGRAEGIAEGKAEGETSGARNTIASLIAKGRITVDEGAEELGITVEEMQAMLS